MKKYIPNILTTGRIVISLLIPYLFILNKYSLILYLLMFAIISDLFDGLLARLWNVTSTYGKIADVIGDKLLAILTILSFCSTINKFFIILLIMEFIIIFVNIIHFIISKSFKDSNSSIVGKIKTAFLFVTLLLGCLSYKINVYNYLIIILIFVTSILQIFTAISYIITNMKKKSIN